MLGHEADLRPVVIEIIQAKERGGGDVRKAIRSEILRAYKKHIVTVFASRQTKDVHCNGDQCAEQHTEDAIAH